MSEKQERYGVSADASLNLLSRVMGSLFVILVPTGIGYYVDEKWGTTIYVWIGTALSILAAIFGVYVLIKYASAQSAQLLKGKTFIDLKNRASSDSSADDARE